MASGVASALRAARKECFNAEDAYWAGDPDFALPINPRNEAAALSQLLVERPDVCRGSKEAEQDLEQLCATYCLRVSAEREPAAGNSIADGSDTKETATAGSQQQQQQQQGTGSVPEGPAAGSTALDSADQPAGPVYGAPFDGASPEAELQRWCEQQGMQTFVRPATFTTNQHPASSASSSTSSASSSVPLRGLMASEPLQAGQAAITVPLSMLVSYRYVMASDLGKVLQRIPGLSEEAAAVVWTMVERADPESALAPFWRTLPSHLGTGLSVGEETLRVALPEGSPLRAEAEAARQHLREQHSALQPVFTTLCQAYPSYFQPSMFEFDKFLWAAELWYAYAITVQLPGGEVQPCLVPFVGLMNHSGLPHIVHYSRVDEQTNTLKLLMFRPCAAGEEVLLSYGPLPNSKLLLFYGFALPVNPFDSALVPLEAGPSGQDPDSDLRAGLLRAAGLDPTQQRLRAATQHQQQPQQQRSLLPGELRACLRLAAANRKELQQLRKCKRSLRRELVDRPLSVQTEAAALRALQAVLLRLQGVYGEAVQTAQAPAQAEANGQAGEAGPGNGNRGEATEGSGGEAGESSARCSGADAAGGFGEGHAREMKDRLGQEQEQVWKAEARDGARLGTQRQLPMQRSCGMLASGWAARRER